MSGETQSMLRHGAFRVGDRVTYRDDYTRKDHLGTLVASPGVVFYGWTVRLDNGTYRGAYAERLRHAA